MNFKPNPLLYGADEDFFGSFKLEIVMSSEVNHETLCRSVSEAMKRYPYFSVCPKREGNSLVLQSNPNPVPVFNDGRCATLGTDESDGHLITFGCEGKNIILNASHYIADGMGIMPCLMTVLYLYVSELYGTEGLRTDRILMPDGVVKDEEYQYPFDKVPMEDDFFCMSPKAPKDVYVPCNDENDKDMLYSYYLHIPQKAMMVVAQPSDGSPVSFLAVMMYRALCALDSKIEKPVVAHVQHQYRPILKAPLSRHSLVSYIPVSFPKKVKDWDVERQNTAVRGQIIMGSEPEADISAVRRLLNVFPDDESMDFADKKKAMKNFIDESVCNKTFGISYVGKMDWCGLEQYVQDIHVYLGEKNIDSLFLMEVMTVGEDFTVTFMQKGRTRRYVDAFIEQLNSFDIPATIVGEEEYTLCDTKIPQ